MSVIFTMLIGLPCSGKSTEAKLLSEEQNTTIFSSDDLREEMFNDVNEQKHNQELFTELHQRIKACLKSGKNAIYDATNINYKRRMAFLRELNDIPCEKHCVVMATPYEECLKRNNKRDRKVPEHIIKRMYMNFNIPYTYEGWDVIRLEYGDFIDHLKEPVDFYMQYKDYDQHNSHHVLTLGNHCLMVGENVGHDITLVYSGLLHDCGKPFCATYSNAKGEATDECHYYNHHNVGAYDSLFYQYYGTNPLDVAIRIMWHMQPYFNKEEKTKDKYRKLLGEHLYKDIMKLHEADKAAH